jgi:Uma2 family endonuclease
MGAVEELKYISPDEYLNAENDRVDGVKYEYVNGHVYAMVEDSASGASRNHNRVAGNFFLILGCHVRGSGCQVFQSGMKVGVCIGDEEHFYYPDVQVTYEQENNDYYNTSPCLIVEVLSSSTARTDRYEKLMAYRLLPSLQEYVLCSQDFPVIEVYRKANNWQPERYTEGQSVMLESVGLELELDDLYDFLLQEIRDQLTQG